MELGDQPVLLMAHGSSDDGLCWTNLAKELEQDYDIIMADARGHGLSDPPAKSDSVDAQVKDLAGLIQQLKLKNPILMGHSMGSSSVAWFAAKYPNVPARSFSRIHACFPGQLVVRRIRSRQCRCHGGTGKASCPDPRTEQHER